jgi:hypothetical protein
VGLDVGWGSAGDVVGHECSRAASRDTSSNAFFYAEDLQQTYQELTARGVQFPQPPVQQPLGWWSLFADSGGNRFALVPATSGGGIKRPRSGNDIVRRSLGCGADAGL